MINSAQASATSASAFGSVPRSKRCEASVCSFSRRAVRRMLAGEKYAHSSRKMCIRDRSMGLCMSLSVELLRGVLSSRTGAEFVRTPKTGGQKQVTVQYRPVFDRLARIEVFVGFMYLLMAALLIRRGDYLTAMGFAGLIGSGLLWVGGGSLRIR